MEPISALPAATARQIEGLCFDIDDTITTAGLLDPAAYAALHALRDAGLRLIAVTGRPLGWAEIAARTWPVDAAVGENGAGWIARTQAGLARGYWEDAPTREQHRARLAQLRARVARELPEARVSSDDWARRCDLAFDVGEEHTLPADRVAQLVQLIVDAGARAVVSSVHAHASYSDCDKPRGTARAARALWGLDLEAARARWLFVGDSGNDATAFQWFPLSAGVANVRPWLARLPQAPAYVSERACGAGFAEIADRLLSARGADG